MNNASTTALMSASTMYAIGIQQVAELIAAVGSKRTVIARGYTGTGKTSGIKALLKKMFPNHVYVEFDCTNKDVQDMSAPKFMKAVEKQISDYVSMVPNEELGVHLGVPVILNFDEFFKASKPVQKGSRRVMLERMVGTLALPEGSIVYGTSNLGSEGLSDSLPAHQRNAIIDVEMRKPTTEEYLEHGIDNGFDHRFLSFVNETRALTQTYNETTREENPYIHFPNDTSKDAFFTMRSGEMASDILKLDNVLDATTIQQALIGAVGPRCALDMMAFVKVADQLPTVASIKADPMTAKIPESTSAKCMVVFRALGTIDRDWVNAWMDYMLRLDPNSQAMFANGVRAKNYSKRSMMFQNKKFVDWSSANNHLFVTDKV